MDVGATFVPDREAPELRKPSQCALDLPPVPPVPLAAADATARYPRRDAAAPALASAAAVVVALVGVQLAGAAARAPPAAPHRRDRVQRGREHPAVVAVGRAQRQAERRALAAHDEVALGARLAAVRRVGPGLRTPPRARAEALSSDARRQSSRSAPRSRSSSARCSAAQTPAACHSTSLRQHVLPLQPTSAGTSRHWMPVRSTKMIPASAARSGTRGLPPFGFAGSGGRSGETAAQRSSGTRGRAMPPATRWTGYCPRFLGHHVVWRRRNARDDTVPASRYVCAIAPMGDQGSFRQPPHAGSAKSRGPSASGRASTQNAAKSCMSRWRLANRSPRA